MMFDVILDVISPKGMPETCLVTFADIHKSVACQLFLPLKDMKFICILICSAIVSSGC